MRWSTRSDHPRRPRGGRVSPRLRFETREYRTARILASAGLAVAILPRSVAEEPGHPIHILRLDPELRWSPVLGWSATRRPGPAVSAFIEYAVERLQARAEIGQSSNARQASRARGAPASGASPS